MPALTPHHLPLRRAALSLAALALAAAAGCAAQQQRPPAADSADASHPGPFGQQAQRARRAAPDRAESGDTPQGDKSQLDAAATDLQNLFDNLHNDQAAPPSEPGAGARSPARGASAAPAANAPSALDPSLALDGVNTTPPTPALAPTSPGTLVATTTVLPAAPEAVPASAPPSPAPPAAVPMTPADAKDLTSIAHGLTPDRPGNPTEPVTPQPAPAPAPIRFGAVALCQKVEGFGRFIPLPSNKFIAGRPALMILYTEIANFSQRQELGGPTGSDTQHVVELSQEVALLLDSDGSRQFAVPEQSIRDVARTPRRDFFICQRLELPRSLSVGKYNLKVMVRDKGTGAEAERIVPIVVVADPSAAEAARSGIITPEMVTTPQREPAQRLPIKPVSASKRQP